VVRAFWPIGPKLEKFNARLDPDPKHHKSVSAQKHNKKLNLPASIWRENKIY
jgi:hypothetical protein